MSIRTDRAIQTGIFLLGLLIGGVVYANLVPIGIGASTDGVSYLMAANSFTRGQGYLSYDLTPLSFWPPLYPTLLGVLNRLSGAGLLAVAFGINVATFVATTALTQLLARRLFPDQPLLVLWAVLTAAGTHVMVAAEQNVGTDYLAAFLALPALYYAGRYIQKPATAPWVGMLVFGTLSVLQRYNGVTVVAVAGLVALFYTPGSFWKKALAAAGQALALIPLGLWALRNISVGTGPFGPRFPAFNGPMRNVQLTFKVLLHWLVPDWVFEPHQLRVQLAFAAFLLLLALVLAAGFYLSHRHKQADRLAFAVPVVAYSVVFVVALIVNASVTYFKDINDRFLVPVFIPLVLTGLIALAFAAREIQHRLPRRAAGAALALLLVAAPLAANWNAIERTPALIAASRSEGVQPDNMYVNRQWQENPAIHQVQALHARQPGAVFYSNLPAGIALYTGDPAYWSPLKNHSVFLNEFYSLGDFQTSFAACASGCYLVWLLPHPYDHMYLPDELAQVAEMEEVFTSDQGIIYRLRPPQGQAGAP